MIRKVQISLLNVGNICRLNECGNRTVNSNECQCVDLNVMKHSVFQSSRINCFMR